MSTLASLARLVLLTLALAALIATAFGGCHR